MIPITELTVLTAPKALWKEWLEAYFDGGVHDVGAHPAVTFPKANIRFGQGRPKQPLDRTDNPAQSVETSAEIRVLCLPRMESATWNTSPTEGEHLLVTNHVLFQFQIRAKKPRSEDAELLADQVGQLLHALLANPDAHFSLARNGIAHLQPRQPDPIAATEWALRLVNCPAQLLYPVMFGATAPPDALITTLAWQSLPFFLESPLLLAEYLPGEYALPFAARLTSANLTAWPGVTDTVLELEVGGVLTGHTITIPTGPPNEEVTASVTINLTIAASAAIRWQVVSGPPAAEDAAWHVALVLQTAAP